MKEQEEPGSGGMGEEGGGHKQVGGLGFINRVGLWGAHKRAGEGRREGGRKRGRSRKAKEEGTQRASRKKLPFLSTGTFSKLGSHGQRHNYFKH